MHILFLPSWYPASPDDIVGSFFREQATALHESGLKVGVIAPSLRSLRRPLDALKGSGTVRSECDKGVPTYRASALHLTPRLWAPTARRVKTLTKRLFEAYSQDIGIPDLVHVHAALPAGSGALMLHEHYGIPFVLSEHSSAYARDLVSASGLTLARHIAVAASRRVAVSRPLSELLVKVLGLATNDFSIVPNPVDERFLKAPISKGSEIGFTFLHISLLDAEKNVASLIDAFAACFRAKPGVNLVIAGDGQTRPKIEQKVRRLGIGSQVSFLGKLSRNGVRAALMGCDAFVLSSRVEAFGVVLIEAMAMGVPVIATRCGGPEDIVTDTSGLLVDVGDTDALGTAMQEMHQNRGRWEGYVIREECRSRFGVEQVSRRWRDIYAEVLSQTKSYK